MSKICQKCGAPMEDNASFCIKCGTAYQQQAQPVYAQQAAQQPAPQYVAPDQQIQPAPKKKLGKGAIIGISAGAGALLLIIVILIIALSGGQGSPKAAFNKYYNAQKSLNVTKYVEASYSSNFDTDKTKQMYIAEGKATFKAMTPAMKDAQKAQAKLTTYKFVASVPLTPQEKAEEIESLSKSYRDTDKIKDIQKITYTRTNSANPTDIYTGTDYAIKVGGKWYIY